MASKQEYVIRVLKFIEEEETEGLDGLTASAEIVAKEEVVGGGWG